MAWDSALSRKYATTSHLRLLNQLRGDLRARPIQRGLEGLESGSGTIEYRPGPFGGGSRGGYRSRPGAPAGSTPASTHHEAAASVDDSPGGAGLSGCNDQLGGRNAEQSPGTAATDNAIMGRAGLGREQSRSNPTFRDRLSAIEMR